MLDMKTNVLLSIKMKLFGKRFESKFFLTVAGFLLLGDVTAGGNEFRRCYNTSVETHCFAIGLQYNDNNNLLVTDNDNARRRCNSLGSHLITIRDEETNNIVNGYMSDSNNPIRPNYVWTDLYRINDLNDTHTWHWVNTTLPNVPDSAIASTIDYSFYTASLQFRSQSGKRQFYLTQQQPRSRNGYICEYPIFRCSSSGSNVLQLADGCYVSVSAALSWFEARNLCLKDGGDLASFANVTSINFTSWLDPSVTYWIGLRFTWFVWKESGEDAKFSKWTPIFMDYGEWPYWCLALCWACDQNSWGTSDCTKGMHVVCHTVTTIYPTTTSTSTTPTSSILTVLTSDVPQSNISSPLQRSESSGSASSRSLAIGVGVGIGVGVLLIVAVIVIVICIVKRSNKHVEQNKFSDNNELGIVGNPSVGQVKNSTVGRYEHMNRNPHSSPVNAYDNLRVQQDPGYEEFLSTGTHISEVTHDNGNNE